MSLSLPTDDISQNVVPNQESTILSCVEEKAVDESSSTPTCIPIPTSSSAAPIRAPSTPSRLPTKRFSLILPSVGSPTPVVGPQKVGAAGIGSPVPNSPRRSLSYTTLTANGPSKSSSTIKAPSTLVKSKSQPGLAPFKPEPERSKVDISAKSAIVPKASSKSDAGIGATNTIQDKIAKPKIIGTASSARSTVKPSTPTASPTKAGNRSSLIIQHTKQASISGPVGTVAPTARAPRPQPPRPNAAPASSASDNPSSPRKRNIPTVSSSLPKPTHSRKGSSSLIINAATANSHGTTSIPSRSPSTPGSAIPSPVVASPSTPTKPSASPSKIRKPRPLSSSNLSSLPAKKPGPSGITPPNTAVSFANAVPTTSHPKPSIPMFSKPAGTKSYTTTVRVISKPIVVGLSSPTVPVETPSSTTTPAIVAGETELLAAFDQTVEKKDSLDSEEGQASVQAPVPDIDIQVQVADIVLIAPGGADDLDITLPEDTGLSSSLLSTPDPTSPAEGDDQPSADDTQTQQNEQNGEGGFKTQPLDESGPIQVDAQAYPWVYMTSTLEACFGEGAAVEGKVVVSSTITPAEDLEATKEEDEEEVANEGANDDTEDIEEEMDRNPTRTIHKIGETEFTRAIELYDALSPDDHFAKEAPKIMQRFLSHGDACARAESAALQLASATSAAKVDLDDEEPLKVYHAQHDELDELLNESFRLEDSIKVIIAKGFKPSAQPESSANNVDSNSDTLDTPSTNDAGNTEEEPSLATLLARSPLHSLPPPPPADSDSTPYSFTPTTVSATTIATPSELEFAQTQLLRIFSSNCLPIIKARIDNLNMALELVDSAMENVSVSLRIESMGLE